ncbi:MAG TPA: hypothetical protein VEL75_03420 [Candidatus Methylomirabilis sp.]|nr:hypothetical protein [Candidatus Methylomirabilis sp.]
MNYSEGNGAAPRRPLPSPGVSTGGLSAVARRLRERLPWRAQLALTTSTYIRILTRSVFTRVLHTRALAADPNSAMDVLSLLDRPNVTNYLLAVKSLLLQLPAKPSVTVLSDGTLQPADVEALEHHIPGIRVLTRDRIAIPAESAATVARWCEEYPYLAKLMYLPFSSDKPLLMILDSDVIFRGPLPPGFARLAPGVAAVFNRDHDHSRYDPCFHYLAEYAERRNIPLISDLNCGVMIWNRAQLRPLDTMDFLRHVVERHGSLHPVAEQDAWTLLASQVSAQPLPAEFLVLSNWPHNDRHQRRRAIATHYVSGERYRRLDYLKDGWRIIRRLNGPVAP